MTVTLKDLDYEDWTDTEDVAEYRKDIKPHVILWEVVRRPVHNQLVAIMGGQADENISGLHNLQINGVNVLGHVSVCIDDEEDEHSDPMQSMVTITLPENIAPFETLEVQF